MLMPRYARESEIERERERERAGTCYGSKAKHVMLGQPLWSLVSKTVDEERDATYKEINKGTQCDVYIAHVITRCRYGMWQYFSALQDCSSSFDPVLLTQFCSSHDLCCSACRRCTWQSGWRKAQSFISLNINECKDLQLGSDDLYSHSSRTGIHVGA